MRAIVVDDSRAMRTLLKSVLWDNGFDVVAEAADGAEALRELDRVGPVDLMLLDWNMPVMSGIDVLTRVRGEEKHAPMRTMMVTTENEAPQILRALDAGADEYLIKPFSKRALKDKLSLLGFFDDCA